MVRVRHSRQEFHARAAGLMGLAVAAALTTGCKSGSWGAKPSWWSSSGTPPASALTSAPSFDKDIAKPSETAKPYPTTSTPEGYALSDATKTDAGRQAASPTGLIEPTAVTYGAAPPPAAAPPAATAPPPAAVAGSSVGPQVGPYASLQPQSPTPPPVAAVDPAGAATAGMAAAPAFGVADAPIAQASPTQPLAAQPPAARYADASGSQAWAASPPPASPATGPVAPAAGLDSRYGEANGSRFGGPSAGVSAPPAAAPLVAPLDPAPVGLAPPAASPVAPPAAAGGDVLPGGVTPPKRRPDPGYRPGGTSSYRPAKTILAGDEPPASGVLPASFEAPPVGE
ncbi:MAG: hypothetical protein ACKO1M_12210 [Planctomycetota bacterium]